MIEQIEALWYDVEILRALAREYYHQACQNPCRYSRGRAGWELLKVNGRKKKKQAQYVELCDMAMSDHELYQETFNILIKSTPPEEWKS